MRQDDANQALQVTGLGATSQTASAENALKTSTEEQVQVVAEMTPTESALEKDNDGEIAVDVLEENGGNDEAASEPLSNPTDAVTAQGAAATNSPNVGMDEDERCEIEKQVYDFDHCTVQIALQLLPDDGDSNGRMVVVGVRSHLDAPILRIVRLNDMGVLPPLVNTLLDELKSELPAREQAVRTALEKKREEKAMLKAKIVAGTKSSQRGKKTKAATLATAPAAATTATDDRPRPNVTVLTNTQQQM